MLSPSPTYSVFLSHNSADKPAVEVIAARLRDEGLLPFLDKWHLVAGKMWQTELAQALDSSQSVAIFFGPSGEGAWHNQEMQVALNRAARTRDDYRVIPVLLPGAEQSQIDGFLELRTWVDFRPGLDDDVAFRRLVAAIKGVAPESAEGLAKLPDEPRPYRGLERFDEASHQFFFGRNPDIKELCERLVSDRLVTVVGASGSGKSSLVLSGLHTEHSKTLTPDIDKWQRIVMRPGNDPLRELAVSLVSHLPVAERPALIRTFREDFLSEGYQGLATAMSTLFPARSQQTLLIVDQLEELFTHRPTTAEQQESWKKSVGVFVSNLRAAFEAHESWLRIIVTLRGDFVDQCIAFPDLCDLIERRQFWLGEMNEDDLREAVVEPARKRGAYFEKGLVEMILSDMRGQGGALPLLEEALDALWNRRRGPWLTIDVYQQLGGVGGALAKKADALYGSLSESDQAIARRVFLGLIQLGEGTRDTRRRSPLPSLISATDDPQRVESIVDRFAASRLISLSTDDAKVDTAEVTHEALIDNWQELHTWLEESRDDLRFHRRVAEAARNWHDSDRPEGSLWRPPDLDLLLSFAGHSSALLTQSQMDFFTESIGAEEARVAEEKRQQEVLRNRLRMTVGAALTALVLMALAAWQWQKSATLAGEKAELASNLEETNTDLEGTVSRLNTSLTETTKARRQAVRETGAALTANGLSALHQGLHMTAMHYFGQSVRSLATIDENDVPNRTRLSILAQQSASLRAILTHQHTPDQCIFSPDGTRLITVCEEDRESWGTTGVAYLWDVRTGNLIGNLDGIDSRIVVPIFSPDGQWIVTMEKFSDQARVWRSKDGTQAAVLAGHTESINHVSFSPDGKRIVSSARDNTARIWLSESGALLHELKGHEYMIMAGHFSPDMRHVVTIAGDETVRVWDADSGREINRIDNIRAHDVTFNADGSRLISEPPRFVINRSFEDQDRHVYLWSFPDAELLFDFDSTTGATFCLEGDRLLVVHSSNIIGPHESESRMWALDTTAQSSAESEAETPVKEVGEIVIRGYLADQTRDGLHLATIDKNGSIRIYSARSGKLLRQLGTGVTEARFSPLGGRLITSYPDNTARLWSTNTGQLVTTLEGHAAPITDSCVSPDGLMAVTASADGTVRLWNIPGERAGVVARQGFPVTKTAFDLEARRFFTVSTGYEMNRRLVKEYDHSVRGWNATSGTPLFSFDWFGKPQHIEAFPASRRLLVEADDGDRNLWLVDTGRGVVIEHIANNRLVAVSPNRMYFLSLGEDDTLVLRGVADGQQIHELKWRDHTDGDVRIPRITTEYVFVDHAFFDPVRAQVIAIVREHEKRTVAYIWDISDGRLLRVFDVSTEYSIDQWLPGNGGRLLIGRNSGTFHIWDANTGEKIREFETPRVRHGGSVSSPGAALLSPDGELLAMSANGTRLWVAETGEKLRTYPGRAVGFSADGKRLLTVRKYDVLINSIETDAPLAVLQHGTDSVATAVYSEDGSRIVTGTNNGAVVVWDAEGGALLGRFNVHNDIVRDVKFMDNRTVLSASSDGTARVLNLDNSALAADLIPVWVESMTGMAANPSGQLAGLSGEALRAHRLRLAAAVKTAAEANPSAASMDAAAVLLQLDRLNTSAFEFLLAGLIAADPATSASARRVLPLQRPESDSVLSRLAQCLRHSDGNVRGLAAMAFANTGPANLPYLTKALQESLKPSSSIDAAEVTYILGLHDSKALAALREAVIHSDPMARYTAAVALRRLGPDAESAIEPLIQAIGLPEGGAVETGTPESAARRQAAEALVAIGEPALPAIVKALDDSQRTRRYNAIGTLEKMRYVAGSAIADLVRVSLEDDDAGLRRNAANAVALIDGVKSASRNILFGGRSHFTGEISLPLYRNALEKDDAQIRLHVVEAVAQIVRHSGSKSFARSTVPILPEAFRDEDEQVVAAAAKGMLTRHYSYDVDWDEIGPVAVPHLISGLGSPGHKKRAIAALEALGPVASAATASLLRMEAHPAEWSDEWEHEWEYMSDISDALRKIGIEGVKSSVELLEDKDDATRLAAVEHVGRFGMEATEYADRLLKRLEDPDERIAYAAAEALQGMDQQRDTVVTKLVQILGMGLNSEVRAESAALLETFKDASPGVLQSLKHALNDGNDGVRLAAAETYYELTKQEDTVVPVLMKLLETGSETDQWSGAVDLLDEIRPNHPRTIPTLARLATLSYDNINPNVRRDVTELLATLGAVDELTAGVKHPDRVSGFHDDIAEALVRAHEAGFEVISPLVGLINEESEDIRKDVVWILGRVGAGNQTAREVLMKARDDQSRWVRIEAAASLERLDSPQESPD